MGIDKAIKRKVIQDWHNAFPQLTVFTLNTLYKIVGPCVLGIELIRSPLAESYSPYFVLYPLWKEDIGVSLDGPIILRSYRDKKGYEYCISYKSHRAVFDDIVDTVRNQTPLPFEGNISLSTIAVAIEDNSHKPPLHAAPNSYLQAALHESYLRIALYVSREEAQRVLELIVRRNWDVNHFNACGVNVNVWLNSLQNTVSKRDEYLEQIEANKQDKKLSKLICSELTAE